MPPHSEAADGKEYKEGSMCAEVETAVGGGAGGGFVAASGGGAGGDRS